MPEYLPALAEELQSRTLEAARSALVELNRLEWALLRISSDLKVTKRSKGPVLARLHLAYPGLKAPGIERLIRVSSQGAVNLEAKVSSLLPD